MKIEYVDYSQVSQLSPIDRAYIAHDPRLRQFYQYETSLDLFDEIIEKRKNISTDRHLLLSVLKKQYSELQLALPFEDKILLSDDAFTVTTSHQPTLFTGPLFHIYKIASTIHLAKTLSTRYPGKNFIPVFVVSGEDHDWPEVNHFHLFGKKYEWEREAAGPCGRLSTEGLDALISTIHELFRNAPFGNDIKSILENCLSKAKNYGQFHSLLIHALFGKFGLLILNPDDAELKHAFVPIIQKELAERFSFHTVVPVQGMLEKSGFKPQAYCRHVNLFYMTDNGRERIDPDGDGFLLHDSHVKYSNEEILKELNQHPDRFSPNVILRPLYQEFLLPNIAYIGGGGEIAYWLDRIEQFKSVSIHFPMLIRRSSAMIVDSATITQWEKLGFENKDFFEDINTLVKAYLKKHSSAELDFSKEMEMLKNAFSGLAQKAEKLDPTLATSIRAEESKQLKQFEQLGSRLVRTEKQLQDTHLKKVQRIKERLFPDGGLQERHENFLSYYAVEGPVWIENIVEVCDPFAEKFILAQQVQ